MKLANEKLKIVFMRLPKILAVGRVLGRNILTIIWNRFVNDIQTFACIESQTCNNEKMQSNLFYHRL